MSTGKFVAGFIVGGVVGAVIGVLLAPQSGEETREMISEGTKEAYNKVSDAAKEIQQKAESVVDEVQKKGEEIIDKIQEMIRSITTFFMLEFPYDVRCCCNRARAFRLEVCPGGS